MSDLHTVLIRGVLTTRHEHFERERREHRLARELRGSRRKRRGGTR